VHEEDMTTFDYVIANRQEPLHSSSITRKRQNQ